MNLVDIARELSRHTGELTFGLPVTHVYNPLDYARASHEIYLRRFGRSPKEVVLLGMNPGPWGMAQTGIPFGEVAAVRDWMAIDAPVGRPAPEHPKRPVSGLAGGRREVSGRRLWGWAQRRFETPEGFFGRFFVANYCPLAFLEASGRNRTPDKLPAVERRPLLDLCDEALAATVRALEPRIVIGLGGFAESAARRALAGLDLEIGRVLHPSPASPLANRGWEEQAEAQLATLGVEI